MRQNPLTNDLATHSEQPFLDIDNIRAKYSAQHSISTILQENLAFRQTLNPSIEHFNRY
jgi:hypothetical protein